LTLDGIIASLGSNPIIVGEKLISATGVSGDTGPLDNQVSLTGQTMMGRPRAQSLQRDTGARIEAGARNARSAMPRR
jgi:hypothetical protein